MKQMSSDDNIPESEKPGHEAASGDNDSLANKLSRELTNWRRNRSSGRPSRSDANGNSFQSDLARTIKVRGHETLVIRKSKLATKPPGDNS
jgi:hypothetical protein